jgi:exopolysaccharide production protein ExoY
MEAKMSGLMEYGDLELGKDVLHNSDTYTSEYNFSIADSLDGRQALSLPERIGINKFLIATVYPYRTTLKIAFDIFLSILLLIVLTPLMLLIAYLVRRDGGPAIFAHQRVGENGKLFYCLKFRTMTVNSDIVLKRLLATDAAANEEWEQTRKLKHDPRITKIGTFLRRTSMDELPQLINVLRGEMNLVGPRPITTEEIPKYGSAIHDYYLCRPGVTGLWQVSGRNNVSYASRVRMDTFYSRKLSFRLDMAILIMTVKSVVSGRGAS